MRRHIPAAILAAALAGTSSAQVTQYDGPGPNIPSAAVDFDNPLVPSGPVPAGVYTGTGITSVTQVGPWTAAGDVLSAGIVNGQCLVSQGGVPAIGGVGDVLDNPGAGGGWDIVLDNPADEFQCGFPDQTGMSVDVELLLGGVSLGSTSFAYTIGAPNQVYFRATGSQFDQIILISTTGSGGYGLDDLGFGNGPGPVPPANDECANATVAMLGSTAFDTLLATDSAGGFACATGGRDVWFEYTSLTAPMALSFDTCGSLFDTVVEVYTGDCNNLVSVGCNDDSACGTQSEVLVFPVAAGTTYLIRVGGWNGAGGAGTFTVTETTPPPPPPVPPMIGNNCAQTIFASNNGGAVGGAVYFNLTATQPITVSGLFVNTSSTLTGIGADLWTTPMTHVGNEGNPAAWTQVATGNLNGIGQGLNNMTYLEFGAPAMLPAGTYGIAIVAQGFNHSYTNGTGANQNFASPDGVVTLDLGSASNAPFTGAPFTPRVWNGVLCHGMATPGTNFCGPAVANSTGNSAVMGASGSADIAANDLVLEASDLPNQSFAFFLTSQTQGITPMAGGSTGTLCLGGQIGRFVGMNQIQNSGATGTVSLAIDNGQQPTPTGLVQIAAGETWNFQCWFRDAAPGGGATSNFTDGLEITFN